MRTLSTFLGTHLGELTATGVILLIAVLLTAAMRLWARRIADPSSSRFVEQTFTYVTVLVLLGAIAKVWMRGFNFGTLLGLTAAGVVLALKDPIASFAGWLFILLRHPFRVGDRVQVGTGTAGDVVEIRLFMFSLLEIGHWTAGDQHTGRVLHVPNSTVLTTPIANYCAGFSAIWNELAVNLSYESDWKLAETRLKGLLLRLQRDGANPHVLSVPPRASLYDHDVGDLTPQVWVEVTTYSVRLTLRYACSPRARRASASAVWIEVLALIREETTLQLAYPTTRFYDRLNEGSSPPLA